MRKLIVSLWKPIWVVTETNAYHHQRFSVKVLASRSKKEDFLSVALRLTQYFGLGKSKGWDNLNDSDTNRLPWRLWSKSYKGFLLALQHFKSLIAVTNSGHYVTRRRRPNTGPLWIRAWELIQGKEQVELKQAQEPELFSLRLEGSESLLWALSPDLNQRQPKRPFFEESLEKLSFQHFKESNQHLPTWY